MKKTFKGFIALMLALMLVVPAFSGALAEQTVNVKGTIEARGTIPTSIDTSGIRNGRTFAAAETEARTAHDADEIVTIMVELKAAPAADVKGDLRSAGDYRQKLVREQNALIAELNKALNTTIKATNHYTVLFNGFAFEGEYRLVSAINALGTAHAFVAPMWEEPELFNTTTQVGAVDAWDLGYTGAGYAVAIIDTGCKVTHPAFSTEPETVAFTKDDIASIIAAGELTGSDMNADEVYYSAKIPFRWNYFYDHADVAHPGTSDHGTHVAGIAAGNGGEIQGVAPDAQLCIMQVFRPQGGASWSQILPALEDAAILGVAAANLSLGSPCGSEDPWDPSINEVLDRCVNSGVNLAMAAGNDYDCSMNNRWGGNEGEPSSWSYTGYSLVTNPDVGVVGYPSTWPGSLSVAAVQNSKSVGFYMEIDGENYGYSENSQNKVKMAEALGGQTVEYVMCGFGTEEDFAGVDVAGKVAVVSRGVITLVEKGYKAQNAGAIACIIYNNTTGALNMVPFGTLDGSNNLVEDGNEGKIPHVAVTQAVGQLLASLENKQITVAAEEGAYDAPGGNQMTSFSSRGLTTVMGIKPEIAAPGGAIYSSTDSALSGADYGTWDGTSMATPHVCGGMAIVSQYVDEMFPDADAAEKKNIVDSILMSTAAPTVGGGDYAPVHEQGAGVMDLYAAVNTKAYLTAENSDGNRPKLELGDDPEKTGVYKMSFTVNNFGEETLIYDVVPSVLMNNISYIGNYGTNLVLVYNGTTTDLAAELEESIAGDVNGDGKLSIVDAVLIARYVMELIELDGNTDANGDGSTTMLDAVFACRVAMGVEAANVVGENDDVMVAMPDKVIVKAGEAKKVTVTVTLKPGVTSFFDFYYTSGALLEGFMFLASEDEEVPELSIPYVAFYGDWNYAPTIDTGYYYEDYPMHSNNYPNLVGYKMGNEIYGLGVNPFVGTEDMSYYLEDRNAISPNSDGFLDTINTLYMGLLRNSDIHYMVCDKDGNELGRIYEDENMGVCTKGFWDTDARDQFGVNYLPFPGNYDLTQFGEEDIVIRLEAWLDNDGRHNTDAFTTDANANWYWEIPVHIDTEAPTVANFAVEDTATFEVTDEHYAAFAGLYALTEDGELGEIISYEGIFEEERGATTAVELEAIDDMMVLIVGDYAGNVRTFIWTGSELIEIDYNPFAAPTGNYDEGYLFGYAKNISPKQWLFFETGTPTSRPTLPISTSPLRRMTGTRTSFTAMLTASFTAGTST